MKAILIDRVSKDDQKENSPDAQRARLKTYVENTQKLTFDREFSFEESAHRAKDRKKFDVIITYINSLNETVAVCCDKVDRLSRDFLVGLPDLEMLRRSGKIEIHCPSDNLVIHKNSPATDLFHYNIALALAQYYSDSISDNVKRAFERKIKIGIYPNQAPIGYKNTPELEKGHRLILKDEVRWDLCRKWWEYMLSGIYSVEQTLRLITADGLRNKKGKAVSRSVAYVFFRNIFYTGSFIFNGSEFPGGHDALISMAEWMKVQHLLDNKEKHGAKPNEFEKEKTFQGMIVCGECGAHVTMSKHVRHYKNGTSQTFWYYNCTKKKGLCKQPHLNATLFEPQLKQYISSLELNPNFGDWVKKVLKRRNTNEFAFEAKQQELRTKRLADITDRKKQLYEMKIQGFYDMDSEGYLKEKKNLFIEEKQIRESLTKSTTTYWESVIDNTVNFATSVIKLFEYGDIFTRQMILKIVGSNFVLKDKKLKIQGKYAFVFLKGVQEGVYQENLWLEPNNIPVLRTKRDYSNNNVLLCARDRT